jgi:hypothetical protein
VRFEALTARASSRCLISSFDLLQQYEIDTKQYRRWQGRDNQEQYNLMLLSLSQGMEHAGEAKFQP